MVSQFRMEALEREFPGLEQCITSLHCVDNDAEVGATIKVARIDMDHLRMIPENNQYECSMGSSGDHDHWFMLPQGERLLEAGSSGHGDQHTPTDRWDAPSVLEQIADELFSVLVRITHQWSNFSEVDERLMVIIYKTPKLGSIGSMVEEARRKAAEEVAREVDF